MKQLKKFLVVFIVGLFVIGSMQPASAAESNGNITKLNTIDINNPSDDVVVSEVMTYDEIVATMAKDMNISLEAAANIVTTDFYSKPTSERSAITPKAGTYRTFEQEIPWDSAWKPRIQFYCETSEGGGFHGILRILSTNLIRHDLQTAAVKYFTGTIFTQLENGSKIHYIIDGDVYTTASGQTASVGGSIGIGGKFTLSFNATAPSGPYGTLFWNGDFNW